MDKQKTETTKKNNFKYSSDFFWSLSYRYQYCNLMCVHGHFRVHTTNEFLYVRVIIMLKYSMCRKVNHSFPKHNKQSLISQKFQRKQYMFISINYIRKDSQYHRSHPVLSYVLSNLHTLFYLSCNNLISCVALKLFSTCRN